MWAREGDKPFLITHFHQVRDLTWKSKGSCLLVAILEGGQTAVDQAISQLQDPLKMTRTNQDSWGGNISEMTETHLPFRVLRPRDRQRGTQLAQPNPVKEESERF